MTGTVLSGTVCECDKRMKTILLWGTPRKQKCRSEVRVVFSCKVSCKGVSLFLRTYCRTRGVNRSGGLQEKHLDILGFGFHLFLLCVALVVWKFTFFPALLLPASCARAVLSLSFMFVCISALYFALVKWSAAPIREDSGEISFYLVFSMVWIALVQASFPFLELACGTMLPNAVTIQPRSWPPASVLERPAASRARTSAPAPDW